LFVHAARNDAKDIDFAENFPNDSEDKVKEFADNVTIGALNFEYGDKVVARFSNIGKLNVDVFAGSKKKSKQRILTRYFNGCALPLELLLYPKLTAKQVKYILMESGVAITTDVIVGGKAGDVRSLQHYPNLVKL
jgi:hypothetical protein